MSTSTDPCPCTKGTVSVTHEEGTRDYHCVVNCDVCGGSAHELLPNGRCFAITTRDANNRFVKTIYPVSARR